MTIEERLAIIERKIDTLISAGMTNLVIHEDPTVTEMRLKPFNRTRYAHAIRETKAGNLSALKEYLQEYKGPAPQKT